MNIHLSLVSPVITIGPKNTSVPEGTPALIPCENYGFPKPQVEWSKGQLARICFINKDICYAFIYIVPILYFTHLTTENIQFILYIF